MKYLDWNDSIAKHFFRPDMAGRSVLLYVTENLLDELGHDLGDTWHDFVSATKVGHPWRPLNEHNLCQKAIHCCQGWRLREEPLEYPPYLAYLGLFVLAAGKGNDFAPNAFYPRLWDLLGDADTGTYPGFNKMDFLWEDLEKWANDDKQGDLGEFTARVAGGIHVGKVIGQTVLTEEERAAVPTVFSEAGLDPTAFPPDSELIRTIIAYGRPSLRRRTLRILDEAAANVEVVSLLLEVIKEELSRWDGQPFVRASDRRGSISGNLRLSGTVDRVAGTSRFGLRCSMNREFPEDGLLLSYPLTDKTFSCKDEIFHWSTEIADTNDHCRLDAAQFNWEEKLEFRDARFGWHFRLRANPVRIFVGGATEGLPGLIEVYQLPGSGPFYLASSSVARPHVEAWGNSGCKGFRSLAIRSGLPVGWSLYSSDGFVSGAEPCETYPLLSPPSSTRIVLRGGIHGIRRNWFLPFGLPELAVEAPAGDVKVTCAGVELHEEGGVYHLPPELPKEQKLFAEVRRGAHVKRSNPFYLMGDFTWQTSTPLISFDRFGVANDSALVQEGYAAGASVTNFSPSRIIYSPHPACFVRRRVFFVGREPGQITSWPAEPLPSTWQPVWAIPLERKGNAIFCGTDIAASEPLIGEAVTDRKKLKLWKDVLYHKHKRIGAPHSPRLAQLWKHYREAANRV